MNLKRELITKKYCSKRNNVKSVEYCWHFDGIIVVIILTGNCQNIAGKS